MDHLLYSSNEMYSSTELIRQSKKIFNKILDNEIDKAIILRDGKPTFMLLDFEKYEKIMAEYSSLKAKQNTKIITNNKAKKSTIVNEKVVTKEELKIKIEPAKVVPPVPKYSEKITQTTTIQKEQSVSSDDTKPTPELKEFWAN
jgi:hypothetical protein